MVPFAAGVAAFRVKLIGYLVVAAALVASSVFAPAVLADPPPAPQSTGDSPQSLRDGCQRSAAALISQQTPEWAYVYNTPSDQPPPPPQWVSGVIDSYNHAFQAVHTSGADFAFGHDAYDFNLNILTDPQYSYLLAGVGPPGGANATGNYPGNGEETGRLHTEWEDLTVPKFAWPEPGDRITEKGSWVWDCGHWGTPTNIFSPDYDLPQEGQPCPSPFAGDPSQCTITGERTEFHPYRALLVERQQSPNSPYGEREGDVFVSTDKTRAGKTEDCAHRFPPPPSTVLPNPASYPPAFRACVETEPNWQDVSGDYSFLLRAPPRPTPDARLQFRAIDKGSVGAPSPTLAQEGDGVRITFHLDTQPNQRLVLAYKFFVGWDTVLPSEVPTHLRVSLDRLEVHRAMDPGCSVNNPVPGCQFQSTRTNQGTTAPGDWNIYWDVNGNWGSWPSVSPGQPPSELLPNDGDSFDGTQSVDLYVPSGKGWRLFVHGRECDINGVDPAHPLADCPSNSELADNNDVQGLIEDTYASAGVSLGTHRSNARTKNRSPKDPTSTCPENGNPEGCYSLAYTVTAVNDAASRVRLPDLAVSKTDSPDPAEIGGQLTYTVTVRNTGPATAGGISLTDDLPSGVSFTSAVTSQGSCAEAGGTVTCGLGILGEGESAAVEIKVAPQSTGTLRNTASVTSNEPESDTGNNTATEETVVFPPHPIGASPMRISLVPAFTPCDTASANASHPAPLSGRSCSPPAPRSSLVAVGPSSLAFLRMRVLGQNECAPNPPDACYPDIVLSGSVTDVRAGTPTGADYETSNASGWDLTATATLPGAGQGDGVRITDSNNKLDSGTTYDQVATVSPLPFPIPLNCIPTFESSVGSTCGVQTTANTLVPGSAVAGKRALWEIGQIQLLDQGPDGTPGNSDDHVFEVEGVFTP